MQPVKGKQAWLTRGVIAVGLTSLFSDVSHEMATVVLPLFIAQLGGGALWLGLTEGLADFLSSAAKLWAGRIGERLPSKKWAATAAYGLTTVATAGLAFAYNLVLVVGARALAWFGRGFRTPLRDSLLAQQVEKTHYGRAFGFERGLDYLGAVVGPLVALLLLEKGWSYRAIFMATAIAGLIAVVCFALGVQERKGNNLTTKPNKQSQPLPRHFKLFLIAVFIFGLGDFSRTLVLLWATGRAKQESLFGPAILFYCLYNAVGVFGAFVGGYLSDRIGHIRALSVAYLIGGLTSAVMATGSLHLLIIGTVFALSGLYMGAQEAIEKAAVARLLPVESRTWGFGLLATVNGVGDMVSSSMVGFLWDRYGAHVAFGSSGALMILGALTLIVLVEKLRDSHT